MAFLISLISRAPVILFRSLGCDSSDTEAPEEALAETRFRGGFSAIGESVAAGAVAEAAALEAGVERGLETGFGLTVAGFAVAVFALLAAAGFFAAVPVLLCGFFGSAEDVPDFLSEARDCPCVEPLGFLSLGFVMVTAPGCSRGVEE